MSLFLKTNLVSLILILAHIGSVSAFSITEEARANEGFFGYFPVENFHTVEPDKLYRSAQLTAESLGKKIDDHGIKSIINLSVVNSLSSIYKDELALAKSRGVRYFAASFNPSRIPNRKELLWLLNAYKTAPRPILVHCYAGADRTGLATAIYAKEYMKKSVSQALENLSFKYFHMEFRYPALRFFIREVFKGGEWAQTHYDPCRNNYQYFDSKLCR